VKGQPVASGKHIAILLLTEAEDRAQVLTGQLALVLPRASIRTIDVSVLSEGPLPEVSAALIDAGAVARGAIDALRLLRARGFDGPIVVVSGVPDDVTLRESARSLGAICIARTIVETSPLELGSALALAVAGNANVSSELAYARRVFAAGQVALSLQHSINNPLAALLAEAQLLQLEELSTEQRASVDRIVELSRRIVALVRRLDGLASSDVTERTN
jgi:signal transduction histidine kinase